MPKTRLDLLLVERGLVESRALAQRLIMAGQVRVDGQVSLKPATGVSPGATLSIDQGPAYVSRGGEKLAAALAVFPVAPARQICADVGASTGGFTDCLLQHGAAKVYAIDVGEGILHWKLRTNPRVVVMENTNARNLEHLPEAVTLVTVDASFISLKVLLPVIRGWFAPAPSNLPHFPGTENEGDKSPLPAGGEVLLPAPLTGERPGVRGDLIALIKPQFEAGRQEVARGDGVVRNAQVHARVLLDVLSFAQAQGFGVLGLLRSPLLGPKGNAEFLAWLEPDGAAHPDLAGLVAGVVGVESSGGPGDA